MKEAAPKAKIYVMGYYFAYPHVHESQKQGVQKELNILHTILKTQAEANGATYVSVEEAFAAKAKELLPNPADVHPSMEGYRVMANAFFAQYNNTITSDTKRVTNSKSFTFEEILNTKRSSNITSFQSRRFGQLFSLTELKPLYI